MNSVLTKPFQFYLNKHINYQEGSVVSREIFKNSSGTVTLFAFAEGQGLSEHKTPFEAIIYIIDGEAGITISKVKYNLKKGEMIYMFANSSHSLKAERKFKMLLIMIRSTA